VGSSKTWRCLLASVMGISPRFRWFRNSGATIVLGELTAQRPLLSWLVGRGVGVPGGAADRSVWELSTVFPALISGGALSSHPVTNSDLGSGLRAGGQGRKTVSPLPASLGQGRRGYEQRGVASRLKLQACGEGIPVSTGPRAAMGAAVAVSAPGACLRPLRVAISARAAGCRRNQHAVPAGRLRR